MKEKWVGVYHITHHGLHYLRSFIIRFWKGKNLGRHSKFLVILWLLCVLVLLLLLWIQFKYPDCSSFGGLKWHLKGEGTQMEPEQNKKVFFFGLVPNLGLTLSKTKLSLGLIRVYIASIISNLSSNLFELVYNVTKGLLIRWIVSLKR